MHCTYTPKNSFKCVSALSRSNWNLETLVLEERGKPSLFEENSSEPSLRYEYSGTNERDLQAASLLHRSCWMKQVSAFPASGGLSWRSVTDLCEQGKCLLGIFLLFDSMRVLHMYYLTKQWLFSQIFSTFHHSFSQQALRLRISWYFSLSTDFVNSWLHCELGSGRFKWRS